MKYIKTYETLHLNKNEKYREINIRDLFEIFISNKSDFIEYEKCKSEVFNFNLIVSEIFENQKISFYGKTFSNRKFRYILGVVKDVSLWKYGGSPFGMELLLNECDENFYKDDKFDVDINIPIKIYSKEISEIEEKFYVLINAKKYNL